MTTEDQRRELERLERVLVRTQRAASVRWWAGLIACGLVCTTASTLLLWVLR